MSTYVQARDLPICFEFTDAGVEDAAIGIQRAVDTRYAMNLGLVDNDSGEVADRIIINFGAISSFNVRLSDPRIEGGVNPDVLFHSMTLVDFLREVT